LTATVLSGIGVVSEESYPGRVAGNERADRFGRLLRRYHAKRCC
jgi:hypothetical protein